MGFSSGHRRRGSNAAWRRVVAADSGSEGRETNAIGGFWWLNPKVVKSWAARPKMVSNLFGR